MSIFDSLWRDAENNAKDFAKFSVQLFGQFSFNFYLSPEWPGTAIRQALALNLSAKAAPGWDIYGITDKQHDIAGYLRQFSRDAHGQLQLKNEAGIAVFYDSQNSIFRIYDSGRKRAAVIYAEGHKFSEWEVHSPFREFWHIWALENNAILIHSGIICKGGSAVLLPGAGGSGKSTTVLSCLEYGMTTTGDDYNLLLQTGTGFIAIRLYANIKMKNPVRFDFPAIVNLPKATLSYADKTIYFPHVESPIWCNSNPYLVGILCPEIKAEAPCIKPVKMTEVLNKLAVSSIMQSPFLAKEYLTRAAKLAKNLEYARIVLSPDIKANAACIESWTKERKCR